MYACTLNTTGQRCIQAGASRHCRLCLGLSLSSSIMSFHQSSQTLSSSIASGRQYLHNLFSSLLSGFKSSHSDFQSIYMQYLFLKNTYMCVWECMCLFVCTCLFLCVPHACSRTLEEGAGYSETEVTGKHKPPYMAIGTDPKSSITTVFS